MAEKTKRMGRPTKVALPGTMVSLGLKVTADLKASIENAADLSGRTQSQEAAHRLQQSFRDDTVMALLRKIERKL